MAKPASMHTWSDGEVIDAALLNSDIKNAIEAGWPGTTLGDTDYYSSAVQKARIPIGSAYQVYMVSSGIPAWKSLILTRKGSNGTDWNFGGATTYNPASAIFQCGAVSVTLAAGSGAASFTYGQAYAGKPIIFTQVQESSLIASTISSITTTGATITCNSSNAGYAGTITVFWLAIGA